MAQDAIDAESGILARPVSMTMLAFSYDFVVNPRQTLADSTLRHRAGEPRSANPATGTAAPLKEVRPHIRVVRVFGILHLDASSIAVGNVHRDNIPDQLFGVGALAHRGLPTVRVFVREVPLAFSAPHYSAREGCPGHCDTLARTAVLVEYALVLLTWFSVPLPSLGSVCHLEVTRSGPRYEGDLVIRAELTVDDFWRPSENKSCCKVCGCAPVSYTVTPE